MVYALAGAILTGVIRHTGHFLHTIMLLTTVLAVMVTAAITRHTHTGAPAGAVARTGECIRPTTEAMQGRYAVQAARAAPWLQAVFIPAQPGIHQTGQTGLAVPMQTPLQQEGRRAEALYKAVIRATIPV